MILLRAKMIEAMQVRGFSHRTHESYLAAVTDVARYTRRAPDTLRIEDIERYFVYLATERQLAGASCRLFLNGICFLYLQVLDWPAFDVNIPIPKPAQRIPELLTRAEVARILDTCTNPRGQTLTRHVHLHCLIPGGTLGADGQWHPAKSTYLFPVRALSRHVRGCFVSRLRQAI